MQRFIATADNDRRMGGLHLDSMNEKKKETEGLTFSGDLGQVNSIGGRVRLQRPVERDQRRCQQKIMKVEKGEH